MNSRIDAVYARQSVDKKDSISIESQIDFCKYELKGGTCKEYTDKGYSGKNTDRPRFKELVNDIEKGLIKRVVVYKLDRISRSIIDFANMMELFVRYNVEFVSSTEKFDTSTPMGRAMLNICIVFAQLERETIQKRVTDAYYSRCPKGSHMSGRAPYGPTVLGGIRTKKMAEYTEEADRVRLMFEMYSQPNISFGDIARYFAEQGIDFNGKELRRVTISAILRNPVYARADLEMYEFFKSQGTVIENDPAEFSGIYGCYLYQGRDSPEKKSINLKGQILVLAPHEGLVSSAVWLACRKKLMNNMVIGGSRKGKNILLVGKTKCGLCDAALVTIKSGDKVYLRCRKRTDSRSCEGAGTLRTEDVEQSIYKEMLNKMAEFQTLTGGNLQKASPKLTALNVELAQIEAEIEKLLCTLSGANQTLLSYANSKIEELDARRQGLMKAIADMSAEVVSPEHMRRISNYLDDWDNTDFDDRRLVTEGLVAKIRATSETVQIIWKI